MGYVFKAFDELREREVAVKVLMFEGARLEQEQARFLQEAKLLSSLQHENIVTVLLSDLTESGDPYYVMELLEGESLAQEIDRDAPLKPQRFYEIFGQVLDGLSCAHSKRIVHRDLKPSNIMLSKLQDGSTLVKLIDFGIARCVTEDASSGGDTTMTLTKTNTIVGSPVYMSPEQCRGARIDHLADIYSLGCIMYECITGKIVFERDSAFQIMYAHMNELPLSLESAAKTDGARALGRLVDSCLKKNPTERPQSADEIKQELNRIYSQHTAKMGNFQIKKSDDSRNSRATVLIAVSGVLLIAGIVSTLVYVRISHENEIKRSQIDKSAMAGQKSRDEALKVLQVNLKNEVASLRTDLSNEEGQLQKTSNSDEKSVIVKKIMEHSGRLAQANLQLKHYSEGVDDLTRTINLFNENLSDELVDSWIAGLLIARADCRSRMGKFKEAANDLAAAEKIDVQRNTSCWLFLNKIKLQIAQNRLDSVETYLKQLAAVWQSGNSDYKFWSSKTFGTPLSLSDALMEIYKDSNRVPAETDAQKLVKAKLDIAIADTISLQQEASKADYLNAEKCLVKAELLLKGNQSPLIEFLHSEIKRVRKNCQNRHK